MGSGNDFEQGTHRMVELLEIEPSEQIEPHDFPFDKKEGKWNVTLLFLPGSNFDLESLQFQPIEEENTYESSTKESC